VYLTHPTEEQKITMQEGTKHDTDEKSSEATRTDAAHYEISNGNNQDSEAHTV
jgi:hypothetical protein